MTNDRAELLVINSTDTVLMDVAIGARVGRADTAILNSFRDAVSSDAQSPLTESA
ncbi:MAG: hypothetical protein AAGE59_10025 [Cyanobacteria bacterium P01_F01_bin.86]